MYNLQWKLWPADTLIYEQFSKPKVYPHYDRDSSMQISVKILTNLVENEEDFYAQLPPSLRGFQTPTDEVEILCRGNYDPREFQKFMRDT